MKASASCRFVVPLFSLFLWLLGLTMAPAQTNIIRNGGFELGTTGWNTNAGPTVAVAGGPAEGQKYALVFGTFGQELPTAADGHYQLTLALQSPAPEIKWGDELLPLTNAVATTANGWTYWRWAVTGTSDSTFLQVKDLSGSGTPLDDVSVLWLNEPVVIQAQPESQTVTEGADVSFSVVATGLPPLTYHWYRDGQPVTSGTNRIFLSGVTPANAAGNYSVIVSNPVSWQASAPAKLTVYSIPETPEIVTQPEGQMLPAGYAFALRAVAIGQPPLYYQWLCNGTNLPGATADQLHFDAVSSADAGVYALVVSNQYGSAQSIPALLAITNVPGGGWVQFTMVISNWIYDADGLTRIAGWRYTNYLAQLYAGADATILHAVGPPVNLLGTPNEWTGPFGFVSAAIPDVPAGDTAYVQARAWPQEWGRTYEEARARGGKFGASAVFSLTTTATADTALFTPILSFKLRDELPGFTTGKIEFNDLTPAGVVEWKLIGAAGFRYLIEKRTPPNAWKPLLVVTNDTGVVIFSDPDQAEQTMQLYRSRILD